MKYTVGQMTVKEAKKHISKMLNMRDRAYRDNMDFIYSVYDKQAIDTLIKSSQKFSMRIENFLREYDEYGH